jgi:hypothetical protein
MSMTQPDKNPPSVSDDVAALMASVGTEPVAGVLPFSDALAERVREEEKRRKEEAIRNARPGDKIEGCGVFIGTWAPVDNTGRKLGMTFNVFAAPWDLPDQDGRIATFTYNEALKSLAAMEKFHGFGCTGYADDEALYAALANDSYDGTWIIPPRELLDGLASGRETCRDNLYAYQDEGTLRNSFRTEPDITGSRDVYPYLYWTCTRDIWKENNRSAVDIRGNGGTMRDIDRIRGSVRLVRLELVSPGGCSA